MMINWFNILGTASIDSTSVNSEQLLSDGFDLDTDLQVEVLKLDLQYDDYLFPDLI